MLLQGYWKFHRRMHEHPVWKRPIATRIVWITILSYANFQEQEWFYRSQRVLIPAGTFITTQQHLADLAGVTRKQVRTAITDLITLESIRSNQRANRYTEITIINWPIYQGTGVEEGQPEVQPRANQGPTKGQDVRMEEGKNGRRKNKTLAPAVDKSTPWADTLDEVRTFLLSIQAPEAFYNETYWLRIDQWLGDKNSQVFYFEELRGYLAWCVSQNGAHQHKDQLRGFRNWLSTAKRWKDRDAQRTAIRGG